MKRGALVRPSCAVTMGLMAASRKKTLAVLMIEDATSSQRENLKLSKFEISPLNAPDRSEIWKDTFATTFEISQQTHQPPIEAGGSTRLRSGSSEPRHA